ncbi:glycosyltransferase, partial [Planctomycetota bacterium]
FLKNLGRLFFAQDFSRLRYLLRNADSLVSVSRGYLDWGLAKVGRTPKESERVFYSGYKRWLNDRGGQDDGGSGTSAWVERIGGRKPLIFIGTFGVSYELSLIVEVARKFHEMGRDDVCFVLAGTGEQEEAIKKQAAGLPSVMLPGWLTKEEIERLLRLGWAGLVACRSIEDTLPNKIFEYLSAALPLVSSLEGEMADLIQQHQLGLNYKPGDASGLFRSVKTLLDQPDLYDKMSHNAERFFENHGDADKIYAEYADHIERTARYGVE